MACAPAAPGWAPTAASRATACAWNRRWRCWRLRRDSYIFQDKNVRDIVTELLADYPQVASTSTSRRTCARAPICTQYRESDLAFFTRLLASEGLSWRFEHDSGDASGDGAGQRTGWSSSTAARVRPPRRAATSSASTACAPPSATTPSTASARAASLPPMRSRISSWDPAQLLAPAANSARTSTPATCRRCGSTTAAANASPATRDAADTHSELMLQALELENKAFEGTGAARRLAAGHGFQLTQHDRYPDGDNAFTVLWVRHEARNNFDTGIAKRATRRRRKRHLPQQLRLRARYRSPSFRALTAAPHASHRAGAAMRARRRPGRLGLDHHARPPGAHPVRLAARQRAPIPAAWRTTRTTRAARPATNAPAPGSASPKRWPARTGARCSPRASAPKCWSTSSKATSTAPSSSPSCSPDRTCRRSPPASIPASTTPGRCPASTATISMAAATTSGSSTTRTGQVRTRLATSTAATQLNLGYLIQQSPGSAQRGAYRGSGFELRTDAWAAVRGGEGVLLSTSARSQQGCGVTLHADGCA